LDSDTPRYDQNYSSRHINRILDEITLRHDYRCGIVHVNNNVFLIYILDHHIRYEKEKEKEKEKRKDKKKRWMFGEEKLEMV